MKNFFSIIIYIGLILITSSCDDNSIAITKVISCTDGVMNGDETGIDCGGSCSKVCPPENAIEGEIVSVVELTSEKEYVLNGPLLVRDGGELIIQAGTVIKARKDVNAYIAVAQGGKFFVYGRQDSPVVITSEEDTPAPGDWGGIIIFGKAPLNNGSVRRSDILDIFYGGNEPEDSSGLIKYLRIEYAGSKYNDEQNFNALSFYGVGSFTTINNIQIYKALGTGFLFKGGKVNSNKLVVTDCEANGISVSDGWNGTLDSLYLLGTREAAISIINNFEEETLTPITSGAINNTSIIGVSSSTGVYYGSGGGSFTFNNLYTSSLNLVFSISGDIASAQIDDNQLIVNQVQFDNTLSSFSITNYNGTNSDFFNEVANNGAGNKNLKPTWAQVWTLGF